MSTPPGGYYDDQGNYVPVQFAQEIDLPDPNAVDEKAVARAERALGTAQRTERGKTAARDKTLRQVRALQTRLKNKKLSAASRKQITAQLRTAQARLKAANVSRSAAITARVQAQNVVYETTGQYEKLLQGGARDAFAALRTMFNQFGLGSLAGKIYEYAKQGYGADVISLLLQDTREYKTRFAANEARLKAGLSVLTPAEYLATEEAYRRILQDAGLPKGFYDNPADFQNWIAGDNSPTEIKGRVDLAVGNTMQANPATVQALQQLYGVDQSYILAYFLDATRALPLLQKQAQAAQFGAEALRRGLQLNLSNLEDFVTAGLSLSQVSQGYQVVAEALPNIQAIAARYGETFGQGELERDIVGGVGDRRRKALASQERALFSGLSGATPGGLSTGFQQT